MGFTSRYSKMTDEEILRRMVDPLKGNWWVVGGYEVQSATLQDTASMPTEMRARVYVAQMRVSCTPYEGWYVCGPVAIGGEPDLPDSVAARMAVGAGCAGNRRVAGSIADVDWAI